MPGGKVTHLAHRQRAVRKEALREQLAEQCRVQHILANIAKLEDLSADMDLVEVQRIKTANEQRIKLLGKYLPDLKAVEVQAGEDGGIVITRVERVIVDPTTQDS